MECLDRFKRKMNRSGGSLRNESILSSKMLISETFQDDASHTPNIYFWELGKLEKEDYKNDKPISIRLYSRKWSSANGYMVKFQTEYDTPIIVGDVLYDLKNDEYYICTESFDLDSIHYHGKLTLCNWILKWQNDKGDILQYPCYEINSTQYNSGETSHTYFTVGTAQHIIYLPCDDNTVLIDSPRRFILDKNKINPTVYIVTQNDTTSYNIGKKGIIKLTVTQYALDKEKDNIELGICDYKDATAPPIVNPYTIDSKIVYDNNVIKCGGDMQRFIGKFFDSFGNELTGIVPKWTIICGFKDKLKVEESDNEIWIGVDDDELIDEDVKLVFSDEYSNYPSSIIIKIDSLL